MSAPRDDEVKGITSRGWRWEMRQSWFMLLFFTVVLYWVPLVYMGLRVLQFRWVVYGLLYALPGAAYALVWASGMAEHPAEYGAGMAASIKYLRNSAGAFGFFALFHAWSVRGEFLVRLAEQAYDAEELVDRDRARLGPASEPGEPAAPSRRLLNVNSVTETELAMLPGLGPTLARQATRLREDMGEFLSFADMAAKLQLPAAAVRRLRPHFEPDSEAVAPAVPKNDPAIRQLADGSRVLEINWADAGVLAVLPGMNEALARKAVALRDGDGPFKSMEDFRFRVGLSMDDLIKLEPHATVMSQTLRPAAKLTRTGGRIVDV